MSKRLPIQFNDEQLELGSSRLADLYHKLTVELFEQMVDRLLERGTTSLTDNPYIWQLEKLNQMHALNEHNLKVISKYTDITEEQLRNVIEGEGLKIYTDTKSQLLEDLNKDPHFDTSHVQKQLEAYLEQASGDIDNLINTTLPNVVNEVYRNIAKETVAKVATGVATPDKAIAETVMKWQEVGFRGFKDRGGKNWRIDNYARTVVKTTTRRVYRQMRTQPADELGIDTFYYSKKATAREACAPLQHHIVTYGEAREEGGYSVLSLADHGYGTPGGCLGINCGHYLTPFVISINDMPDLGDDVKNITPEDAIRNANAQAKQRALERSIRDSKEKLHIANKLGDKDLIDKYKSRIRTQQGAMRDFLKDKPFLRRDYAREKYYKGPYTDAKKEFKVRKELDKLNELRKPRPVSQLKSDLTKAYSAIERNPDISRGELQNLFSRSYDLGTLPKSSVLGEHSGASVQIPNHMLSYILTKHRGQMSLEELQNIDKIIQNPNVLSEDIKGQANTFNLMKQMSDKRFMDAVIMDKNGQVVTHFMVTNEKKGTKKVNKLIKSGRSYDIFEK